MLGTNQYFTCHNHDDLKISYLTNKQGIITNRYYKYYLEKYFLEECHYYVLNDNYDRMSLIKYSYTDKMNNQQKVNMISYQPLISMDSQELQLNEIIPFIKRVLNLKVFL